MVHPPPLIVTLTPVGGLAVSALCYALTSALLHVCQLPSLGRSWHVGPPLPTCTNEHFMCLWEPRPVGGQAMNRQAGHVGYAHCWCLSMHPCWAPYHAFQHLSVSSMDHHTNRLVLVAYELQTTEPWWFLLQALTQSVVVRNSSWLSCWTARLTPFSCSLEHHLVRFRVPYAKTLTREFFLTVGFWVESWLTRSPAHCVEHLSVADPWIFAVLK